MTKPTFDADGYPTEETLEAIVLWPFNDPDNLVGFVRMCWWPDFGAKSSSGDSYGFYYTAKRTLELHTGGWSGNEAVISALRQNVFWSLYWEKSKRGGHHYFIITGKHDEAEIAE